MTTTMTLGPLINPFTPEERRHAANFARTVRERGGEMWVVEDQVIGCVYAWATVPGPESNVAASTTSQEA